MLTQCVINVINRINRFLILDLPDFATERFSQIKSLDLDLPKGTQNPF